MMISLTYLSSATRPFGQAELEQLLATSRRNNAPVDVTGMLLYADDHFIQTLEGDEAAVEKKFTTICADTRHHNIIEALRDSIEERVFADWAMGFESLTPDQVAAVPGFTDYLKPNSELYKNNKQLGRAGIFHRIFRDDMRLRV